MRNTFLAASLLAPATLSMPTVYMPLQFYAGANHKISTTVLTPNGAAVEVVYDSGSENFLMLEQGSIENFGADCLGCVGPCNVTVPGPLYNYTASPTAEDIVTYPANQLAYSFGAFTKLYNGDATVNDTFTFANAAGQKSKVTDVRVAAMDYVNIRGLTSSTTCPIVGPDVDLGILGVSPYRHDQVRNTTGPSVREDLRTRGVVPNMVQSMWFDKAPAEWNGTYTGGGLFGGIDTSKYEGPLVKLPLIEQVVGYYVPIPKVIISGIEMNQSTLTATSCLLDSGTHNDDLPISYDAQDAFFNASGISYGPSGTFAYPSPCNQIPDDRVIELEFAGLDTSQSITIEVPIKTYARDLSPADEAAGWCTLSIDFGDCLFGAPFLTQAFLAADDDNKEIALAKGGVSEPGCGPDEIAIVTRIP